MKPFVQSVSRRGMLRAIIATIGATSAVLCPEHTLAYMGQGVDPTGTYSSATTAELTPTGDAGQVPMFRGNPERTGTMPGPGPDPTFGVDAIWRFPADEGIRSSPAVVNGAVYVGSYDSNVYAIDVATGSERWRFQTGDSVSSSPGVVNGVVYIGSDDGNVYAIDAITGIERWRFATTISSPVRSSPAVAANRVFTGCLDGNVYAIDTESGTERWRFDTDNGIHASSPVVASGVVYAGSHDEYIYAIDAATGEELWRFEAGSWVDSSPAVADGVVYVGSYEGNQEGIVYAINAATGVERWRFQTRGPIYSSPAVVDGMVYVGSDDGNIYAIGARPLQLEPGQTAQVTRETILRGGPTVTAVERTTLSPGTLVTLTGQWVEADGITWWPAQVIETAREGWLDSAVLEPVR